MVCVYLVISVFHRKKKFILNKFSNYHLFRQTFMIGVWTVAEQKETMKYITFKCYLRLTPFFVSYVWFHRCDFCVLRSCGERALSKRKTMAPHFWNDYGRWHKWERSRTSKSRLCLCRFRWENEGRWHSMYACIHTHSPMHTHWMHCRMLLLRKHCSPIIGVKYITCNYFMDAKEEPWKKNAELGWADLISDLSDNNVINSSKPRINKFIELRPNLLWLKTHTHRVNEWAASEVAISFCLSLSFFI